MWFLKDTFHLQLLQNIDYIHCVVQYILEPILHSVFCIFHFPIPVLPLLPLLTSDLYFDLFIYMWEDRPHLES